MRKRKGCCSVFGVTLASGMLATPLKPTAAVGNGATRAEGGQVCGISLVFDNSNTFYVWGVCYFDFSNLVSLADVLDIKTSGCVKAEECEVVTTLELFFNKTVFVLTRHCCDTPFCNTAHKLPIYTLLYLTVALLITWPPHWSLKETTINHLYLFIDVKELCVKRCWKDNYIKENDFCVIDHWIRKHCLDNNHINHVRLDHMCFLKWNLKHKKTFRWVFCFCNTNHCNPHRIPNVQTLL